MVVVVVGSGCKFHRWFVFVLYLNHFFTKSEYCTEFDVESETISIPHNQSVLDLPATGPCLKQLETDFLLLLNENLEHSQQIWNNPGNAAPQ